MNMGNLSRLSYAKTRSISAENFTGEKSKGAMATEGVAAGCARDLGVGWKMNPFVRIEEGQTLTLAEIDRVFAYESLDRFPIFMPSPLNILIILLY
jgi:hypothetical protein